VQRYVLVEDSGAAKAPSGTDTHLDMWIDGQDGTKQATDDCENEFTGRVPAQVNPPDNLPVMAGPIFANQKCNIPPQASNMGTYKDSDRGQRRQRWGQRRQRQRSPPPRRQQRGQLTALLRCGRRCQNR